MGQLELTYSKENQCFMLKDRIIERRIQKIVRRVCKKLDKSNYNIKVIVSIEIGD